MWKTLHAAIAPMVNLFKRRSFPSPLCPLCNSHEESIDHLFLLCPWVEVVWFGGALNLRINQEEVTTWANWLLDISSLANSSKNVVRNLVSYVAFTCWQIWKSRCNFLFNQQPINLSQVIAAISISVGAFIEATCLSVTCPMPITLVTNNTARWTPPSPGFIKINVDASWVASMCSGFAGVVTRDEEGNFLVACRYCMKATSVAMAEALAIMHGCELGIHMGWIQLSLSSTPRNQFLASRIRQQRQFGSISCSSEEY